MQSALGTDLADLPAWYVSRLLRMTAKKRAYPTGPGLDRLAARVIHRVVEAHVDELVGAATSSSLRPHAVSTTMSFVHALLQARVFCAPRTTP